MNWLELRVPPLAVVAATAALMWLAARLAPSMSFPFPGHAIAALVMALAGMTIAAISIVEFRKVRTTVNPMTPGAATGLVRAGVYRISRNPMYLGSALVLLGYGIHLAHPVSLLALPAFVAYLTRFQIEPEEKALSGLFGSEYLEYQQAVRRWL